MLRFLKSFSEYLRLNVNAFQSEKAIYFIITTTFLFINAVLLHKNGLKVVADSHRYLEYAANLRDGFYFDPHNFWYFGYVLFIYCCTSVSDSLVLVITFQYCLSFLAVFALYKASKNIFNKNSSALISALLFLLFAEISAWNSYLLAESVYISFVCFSAFFLTEVLLKKNRSFAAVTMLILTLIICSLMKPTGIAVVGSVVTCIIIQFLRSGKKILAIPVSACVIFAFFLLVNRVLTTFHIIENYQLGEIIYGVTTLDDNVSGSLRLSPPENLSVPGTDIAPVLRILVFAIDHPVYWSKLFLAKAFYLLIHVRPYWSTIHNIFSLGFLLPVYYFFFQAFRSKKMKSPLVIFVVSFLLIQIFSVCLTSEDWDGRFLMPMLPVIFIFSGHGLSERIKFSTST